MSNMDSMPVTNKAGGESLSTKNKILDTGAAITQSFAPIKNICAHLNAFHAYVDEPGKCVEANHYCSHLNEDVRQCLLYDSPSPKARLIGIEYMISTKLFNALPQEERKLWHSHLFEVKSGMLIMPKPAGVPRAAWEVAENTEMEEVVTLYGKVFHTWDIARGDKVPMGLPTLMTSYTQEDQMKEGFFGDGQKREGFEYIVADRDKRFGEDFRHKREIREYIKDPELHEDADWTWKKGDPTNS